MNTALLDAYNYTIDPRDDVIFDPSLVLPYVFERLDELRPSFDSLCYQERMSAEHSSIGPGPFQVNEITDINDPRIIAAQQRIERIGIIQDTELLDNIVTEFSISMIIKLIKYYRTHNMPFESEEEANSDDNDDDMDDASTTSSSDDDDDDDLPPTFEELKDSFFHLIKRYHDSASNQLHFDDDTKDFIFMDFLKIYQSPSFDLIHYLDNIHKMPILRPKLKNYLPFRSVGFFESVKSAKFDVIEEKLDKFKFIGSNMNNFKCFLRCTKLIKSSNVFIIYNYFRNYDAFEFVTKFKSFKKFKNYLVNKFRYLMELNMIIKFSKFISLPIEQCYHIKRKLLDSLNFLGRKYYIIQLIKIHNNQTKIVVFLDISINDSIVLKVRNQFHKVFHSFIFLPGNLGNHYDSYFIYMKHNRKVRLDMNKLDIFK